MMYSSKWRHWRELAVGGKCNLGSGGSWRRGVEGLHFTNISNFFQTSKEKTKVLM